MTTKRSTKTDYTTSNRYIESSFTMPFGRHRGKRLSDIPMGYLRWLLSIPLTQPLLGEVEEVVYGKKVTPVVIEKSPEDRVDEIIKNWQPASQDGVPA